MKTASTSTLIRAYLKRRSTPATTTAIIRSVSGKTSVKNETIRRTVYRMVNKGAIVSVPVRGQNAGRPGFVLA